MLAFFLSVLQGILPRIIPRACLVKTPQAGLSFASPRGFLFLAAVQHPAAHRPVPEGPHGAQGTRASDSSHPKGLGALEERRRSAWSRKGCGSDRETPRSHAGHGEIPAVSEQAEKGGFRQIPACPVGGREHISGVGLVLPHEESLLPAPVVPTESIQRSRAAAGRLARTRSF